jgi:serine phosphatase RsbU (regulator of sigma subunit)
MDPADLAFGTDRIQAVLEAHRGADPSAILDRLEEAVAEHVGPNPPHDDINLVLVQNPAP